MDSDNTRFRDWLEAMQPRLARFEDFLLPSEIIHPDGTREPFPHDYSRESLEQVEQYLLDRWPDLAAFKDESDTDFTDGAVRYIGETYLLACGGGWHYSDAPNFAFRGRPYLKLDTLDQTPISPYNLITALLGRRTGRELVKLFDAQQRRIDQRRDQEPPGWQPVRDAIPGLVRGNTNRDTAQPELAAWLAQRQERLNQLQSRAADATLDLSAASLLTAAQMALAEFATDEELEDPDRAPVVDLYLNYIGEVFLHVGGGQWKLNPGDITPAKPYIGRPFVARNDADGDEVTMAPLIAVSALLQSRDPGKLPRMLENYARD